MFLSLPLVSVVGDAVIVLFCFEGADVMLLCRFPLAASFVGFGGAGRGRGSLCSIDDRCGSEDTSRLLVLLWLVNIIVSNSLWCCLSYFLQSTGGKVDLLAAKILALLSWVWVMSSIGVLVFLSILVSNSSWRMSEVTAIRWRLRISWALMMNGRPNRVLIGRSSTRPI